MLAKRIIPCLDVKDGKVVKGIQFRNHHIVGDIESYARYYCDAGADELVFYDITASSDGRCTDRSWITRIAQILDIPFCVAGGIRSINDAEMILAAGADKISINSPALEHPELISALATRFGCQCVVIGIDSRLQEDDYYVYQYTGDLTKVRATQRRTKDWIQEVQQLGAGEIVVNCMNQDGVRSGYDIKQLSMLRPLVHVPLIASGGAGTLEHFKDVFMQADVDGALAASVLHSKIIQISDLKQFLSNAHIRVRT